MFLAENATPVVPVIIPRAERPTCLLVMNSGREGQTPPVCTDNLNAGVAMMKSAQDGA